MNEDERGITPANVTSISVSGSVGGWWVIIEQGNGDVIKEIKLTEMERLQLGMMLGSDPGRPPLLESVSFVEFDRASGPTAASAGCPGAGGR